MRLQSSHMALLIALAQPVAAQQADTCFASSGDWRTMWIIGNGGSPELPSTEEVVALLTGQYRLVLVTTEGAGAHTIAWHRLWLVPTDSAFLRECYGRGPCPNNSLIFPLGGRLDEDPAGFMDRITKRQFDSDPRDIEAMLDLRSGALSLRATPGFMVDAGGPGFSVEEVSAAGFRGRWADGGLAVSPLKRGGLPVFERIRGYYCAYRNPAGASN